MTRVESQRQKKIYICMCIYIYIYTHTHIYIYVMLFNTSDIYRFHIKLRNPCSCLIDPLVFVEGLNLCSMYLQELNTLRALNPHEGLSVLFQAFVTVIMHKGAW